MRITWDHMQQRLQCCGVENYTDWYYSPQWRNNKFVPDSCCNPSHFQNETLMSNCGKSNEPELYFSQGCYELFSNWLLQHLSIIAIFAVIFVIVEVIVLIVTGYILWTLMGYVKNRTEWGYHYPRGENNEGECRTVTEEY
jgi:hypothetical protein